MSRPWFERHWRRVKLRHVEVLRGQGMSVADAVRQIAVTVQTSYRWRRLYGGMGREQLRRLKELETSRSDGRAASPKKDSLWLHDGSCVRLHPERPNHVWSYDFVQGEEDRKGSGGAFPRRTA